MNDDDVTILHPHGKPPPVDTGGALLPCLWCKTPTQRATLAHYGARCWRCYEAYCGEVQPRPDFMGDRRVDGPLAWARALKAREEAGERLSLVQQTMWRDALGLPITGAISTWEQTPEEYAGGHPNLEHA
jgi:hypothetical protein